VQSMLNGQMTDAAIPFQGGCWRQMTNPHVWLRLRSASAVRGRRSKMPKAEPRACARPARLGGEIGR
jgi:hypothetical protein